MRWLSWALCCGFLGCTSSKTPESGGFVYWEETLDEDNPKVLVAFEGLSRGYGCTVKTTDASVVGLCGNEGDIVMRKEGKAVVVGCRRVDSLMACRALFTRIVQKPGA